MRVQDLDFERRQLTVRNGKGGKDSRTLLPGSQCEGAAPDGRVGSSDSAVCLGEGSTALLSGNGFFRSENAGRMILLEKRSAIIWTQA